MNTQTPSRPVPAAVDGLLLLNKPAGLTSNQALQRVKRLLNAKKAGHTGALDPAATGMLPLCFGEATKVCAYLLDADKTYRVTAKLGEATDTGDSEGKVTATAGIPALNHSEWQHVLDAFVGTIMQVPPMYSALKKDGKRLYELARQGQVVDREARPVRIKRIDLLEASGARLVFRVSCSKGTYVRTLVEDVAKAAGTVAHTASLHRETVGRFRAEDMLDLASAEKAAESDALALRRYLLPADTALADWPQVSLGVDDAVRFSGGQRVRHTGGQPSAVGLLRVYRDDRTFLGVGELGEDGWLAPKRVFR
jgi:tRNA pseudouridine55 synthase